MFAMYSTNYANVAVWVVKVLDLVFDILFTTGDDPREWSTILDIASMANSVVGMEIEQDSEVLPLFSIEATVCQ